MAEIPMEVDREDATATAAEAPVAAVDCEEERNSSADVSMDKDEPSAPLPPLQESTGTTMEPKEDTEQPIVDDDDAASSSEDTLSIDSRESDADFSPDKDPTELIVKASTLKEEGNTFFKEGSLSKAAQSYRKGINRLKPLNKKNTGDEQVKALLVSLQTNLSMVCWKQDKVRLSRDVATQALEIDPQNVKALFRRAVAQRKLGNVKEARDDLKQALKYDANNVAVRKELIAIKKQLEDTTAREKKQLQKAFSSKSTGSFLYNDKEEEERRKQEAKKLKKQQQEEERKRKKAQWEDECVKRMAAGEEAISFEDWEKEQKEKETEKTKEEERIKKEEERKARAALAKPTGTTVVRDDSDDELTEKELAMLRGYKKTSDGRTTSYFTRELSDSEKALLGNTAPKKLGPAPVPASNEPSAVSPTPTAEGKGKASAWNQAGTWEEKNTTEWCSSHLRSKLLAANARPESHEPNIALVTKVESLTGDASVAVVGGKKRYIFDFHAALDYEIRDDTVDEIISSGSFKLPDINSASHDELEVDVLSWKKSPSSEMANSAEQCRALLVDAVRSAVQEFVQDFNAHY